MNIQHQLKNHRLILDITQDELADRIYVSRQTISNWENGKSYPDIHSLVLLSELFQVSLDDLVKGDVDTMKKSTSSAELYKFKRAANVYTTLFVVALASIIPAVYFFDVFGLIITIFLFVLATLAASRVEKIKKENDAQTYREILAFMNGEKLDEIEANRENKKQLPQKMLLGFSCGLIVLCIGLLAIWLRYSFGQ